MDSHSPLDEEVLLQWRPNLAKVWLQPGQSSRHVHLQVPIFPVPPWFWIPNSEPLHQLEFLESEPDQLTRSKPHTSKTNHLLTTFSSQHIHPKTKSIQKKTSTSHIELRFGQRRQDVHWSPEASSWYTRNKNSRFVPRCAGQLRKLTELVGWSSATGHRRQTNPSQAGRRSSR